MFYVVRDQSFPTPLSFSVPARRLMTFRFAAYQTKGCVFFVGTWCHFNFFLLVAIWAKNMSEKRHFGCFIQPQRSLVRMLFLLGGFGSVFQALLTFPSFHPSVSASPFFPASYSRSGSGFDGRSPDASCRRV